MQDVQSSMANNFLLLNSDKTEVVGPKQLRITLSIQFYLYSTKTIKKCQGALQSPVPGPP